MYDARIGFKGANKSQAKLYLGFIDLQKIDAIVNSFFRLIFLHLDQKILYLDYDYLIQSKN